MNYEKMKKADLIAELEKRVPDETINHISDNNIDQSLVIWDSKALESVDKVAQGLLNMTELFKSQKIEINSTGIHLDGVNNSMVTGCMIKGPK